MSKIYAPLGYNINYNGKDYYDTEIREDLLAGVLGLADWPEETREKIEKSSEKELTEMLADNGFEVEE